MRRQKQTISIALISWILTVTLSYADETTTEIPFRLHREHFIIVAGSIGGLEDLNFVIDTGVSRTVVSTEVAKKLGLKGETRQVIAVGRKIKVREVVLPDIRMGESSWPKLDAMILEQKTAGYGTLDGILGTGALELASIQMDFQNSLLSWSK